MKLPGAPCILVVDDEPDNRVLLALILRNEGFAVLTAGTGEEALAIVAASPPDLILLDVMMPDLDGCEVAGRLKAAHATRNLPIILVTARHDREAAMLLRSKADGVLRKPFTRAEVCARVREELGLAPRMTAPPR
ncbi:MAG: response regulator [Deltaproteobacteria bacterium]|nr:response regulator [Deltaproteobacteria bacterium]